VLPGGDPLRSRHSATSLGLRVRIELRHRQAQRRHHGFQVSRRREAALPVPDGAGVETYKLSEAALGKPRSGAVMGNALGYGHESTLTLYQWSGKPSLTGNQ